MKNIENKKVTSLEKLIEYNQGDIVKLPDFGEGQEFYARLKRPSLLSLVISGKIPNTLLASASELFSGGAEKVLSKKENQEVLKELYNLMDIICDATFVEPAYKELKEAGVQLTDEQLLAVFGYTQIGVKQLESFRK